MQLKETPFINTDLNIEFEIYDLIEIYNKEIVIDKFFIGISKQYKICFFHGIIFDEKIVIEEVNKLCVKKMNLILKM